MGYNEQNAERASEDAAGNSSARQSDLPAIGTNNNRHAPAQGEPTTTAAHSVSEKGESKTATTAQQEAKNRLPGNLVDDTAKDLLPGQMRKSEFLGQLRGAITATAETALSGTLWSVAGCPWIDYWFGYYEGRDARSVEKAIQRYTGTSGVGTAADYIPIISSRVRGAIAQWSRTGEVKGVPEGVPTGLPGTASMRPRESDSAPSASPVLLKPREGAIPGSAYPQAVRARLDPGAPLDGSVRSRMESVFGQDFSGVRVHTDANAGNLSAELRARAFTIGKDIAFGSGEYNPGTMIGDALIAHELAHVVQQGGSTEATMQKGEAQSGVLEEDADASAVGAVVSLWGGLKGGLAGIARNAMPRLKSGLRLQRCGCEPSAHVLPTGILPLQLPSYDCSSPQGVTLDETYKIAGRSGPLGVTRASEIKLGIKTEGSFGNYCKAILSPAPAFSLATFVYTAAGTYDNGSEKPKKGRCKGKSLARKLEITTQMADKLKQGESEHCEDSRRSFALTFGRYERAIGELGEYCAEDGKCDTVLKRHFKERTGIDFDSRMDVARCLHGKEDLRDSKGWHDVKIVEGGPDAVYDRKCTTVTYKPDYKKQLPDVSKHPAEELIKGCGEGVQPKLKIGQSNDPYEQEADRIAQQVTSIPDSAVQAKPG